MPHCTSPTVLQERIDKEMRGVTAETESAAVVAGANGVSDVTGSGEESSEGDSDKVEQVIDSVFWKLRRVSRLNIKNGYKQNQPGKKNNPSLHLQTKAPQEHASKQLHGECAELPSNTHRLHRPLHRFLTSI